MKKFVNYSLCLLLVTTYYSCQDWSKEVYIDEETFPPIFVVNCYFTPDSLWKVNLTQSKLANDDGEIANVENAMVFIYEGNVVIDTLPYASNGNYISTSKKPEYGKQYSLQVVVDGFETITATGKVPDKPIIENMYLDSVEYVLDSGWDYTIWGQDLIIEINDNGYESNFYCMKIPMAKRKQSIKQYQDSAQSTYIYYDSLYYEDAWFIKVDPVYPTEYGATFFSDELFNGEIYPLRSAFLTDDLASYRDTTIKIIVQFQAISEDYYLFKKSSDQQLYQFSEPQNRYTNIENGLGIFAGYSNFIDSVDVN